MRQWVEDLTLTGIVLRLAMCVDVGVEVASPQGQCGVLGALALVGGHGALESFGHYLQLTVASG